MSMSMSMPVNISIRRWPYLLTMHFRRILSTERGVCVIDGLPYGLADYCVERNAIDVCILD